VSTKLFRKLRFFGTEALVLDTILQSRDDQEIEFQEIEIRLFQEIETVYKKLKLYLWLFFCNPYILTNGFNLLFRPTPRFLTTPSIGK
jgi:hypothetical protein